jgi:hypothetical protein
MHSPRPDMAQGYDFATCARIRSSRSRISGVNSAPKSSAS